VATRAKRELFGEVQVRSAVVPHGDWSPDQAIGLLGQGYSVDPGRDAHRVRPAVAGSPTAPSAYLT